MNAYPESSNKQGHHRHDIRSNEAEAVLRLEATRRNYRNGEIDRITYICTLESIYNYLHEINPAHW